MRLKQFFSVLLMLLTVNITAVWGEEITWSFKTLQVTSGTQNGITWETGKTGTATATACNSTNGLVLYGVSSGGGYFQTTTAIAGTITNVNIVSTAKKNTPKYTIYCSSNGTDWTSIEAGITAGTKDKAIDGSYTYLKIANTTAATAQLGVTSITITYTPSGSEESAGSMTPNLTSVEVGQEGEDNGSISIEYSGITDMTNVVDVKIYSDAEHTIEITNTIDWLTALWNTNKTAVEYVVDANTGAERTAYIYLYALDDNGNDVEKVIPVTQAEYVAPFEGLKLTFDVSSNPGAWPTSNSTTTTNYTYTLNEVDYTFALNNVKSNSGYLMLTATAKLGLPAISGYKLVKVEAKNSSGCSTSTKVKVSSDVNGENVVSGGTEQTWATQSSTYTYTLTGTEENTMYYLYVTNKNCQITELVLYYVEAEAAAVATPSISGEDNFLNSTEVSMTCATEGAAIYYTTTESAKATPATSGDWAAYDSENKPSFSATTTVWAAAKKDAAWSAVSEKTFTKATVLSVAEALAIINAWSSNQTSTQDYYVAGTVSTVTSLTVGGTGEYYISDDGTTTTQLQVYKGLWIGGANFSSTDQLYVGDAVTVKGKLRKYSSYKELDQNNEVIAHKPIARLSWSDASYNAEIDGSNSFPTLTNTNSVSVTYSSSNTDAATINASTGAIELVAEGSTTITATFAGNETYKANSASYELTVAAAVIRADISFDENGGSAVTDLTQQSNLPNPLPATTKAGKNFGGWYTDSEFNTPAVAGAAVASTDAITLYAKWLEPYTVAEALAMIDELEDGGYSATEVYVSGIVCTASTSLYSSKYLSYYISADGTEDTRLYVFDGLDENGAAFTDKTDIQKYDEVVVYGKLQKYVKNAETTPEIAKDNEIYSLNRKADAGLAWSADEAEATIGEENTFPNLTNDNAVAVTYSSSETDYATIDASTGEITLVAAGQTTITATFAGDATYKAASVSYTLTVKPVVVHGSITYVENGGETVDDVADATELPNPLPTTTKDGHKFLGWYTDSELTTPAVAGAALTGNITLYAAWEEISAWAYEYNSNVTISSSESKKVIISNVEYDAAKANKGASATITLPLNTTKIHLHLVAWNTDDAQTVTVSGNCFNEAKELVLTADAGVSGSSNYTLAGNAYEYYFSLTPDKAVTENEVITITAATGKRFVLFGVNQEGGILPVLDHITIGGEATNLEYEIGDEFNPAGLTVNAIYTLNEEEQAPVDVTNEVTWTYNPATLEAATTSVEVTATYGNKNAVTTVSNIVMNVPAPQIEVSPEFVNFGSVEQNAVVADKNITVTLKSVAAASIALTGTGASAFSIDKNALTENGTLTVTPNTTVVGTYNAIITISDDAAAATDATITLMMTVTAVDTEDDLTGTWTLVTDAAQLAAGKKVIVAEYVSEGGAIYTMSTQATNNRTAVESTVAGTTLTPATGTRVMTIEVPEAGKFALKTNKNTYLYAASSSANNLKEKNELDDNGKWTITITDGKAAITAQGSFTRNIMRFNNTGTARLFSCYASGQKDIALYMLEESDPEPVYTEVRNGLVVGRFYTICLDRKFSAVRGATLWDIENGNNDEITLIEAVLSGNNAGKPYILIATATTMEVAYGEETTTTAGSNNGLHGTFVTLTETELDGKYILSENQLWYVDVTGGSANVTLAANRAYLDKSEVTDQSAEGDAPARRRMVMAINNPSHTPTSIDVVNMQAEGVQKVVIDGNLYIVRDGHMYDTTGRLVK